MLFNSYSFIFLYLPVVFAGMFWLGRRSQTGAAAWLALASLVFYGLWDARFVLLLLASIAFNYGAAHLIDSSSRSNHPGQAKRFVLPPKTWLTIAITANLVLLAYFKYANFFLTAGSNALGLDWPGLHIVLPLGISFFTFTQIAFLVDVYRGVAREYRFVHYLLFITYFPHLIAGPVIHHKQMMPQFANAQTYRIQWDNVAVGVTIFVLGLAKKVLVADELAGYVSMVFDAARDGHAITIFEAWVGALGYTFQLYFDFSGYCDMAIGLSLMFNIRLPMNFDSPYKAVNIIAFWRRWHITLSTFLRDYLYFPLGGNRNGLARRYVNLMLTMLLGGLWHGAGWTFVLWGGLHGIFLVINHAWQAAMFHMGWQRPVWGGNLVSGALTFVCVVLAWVFFRADNLAAALAMLDAMRGHGNAIPAAWVPTREALKMVIGCAVLVWLFPNTRQLMQHYKPTWDDLQVGKSAVEAGSARSGQFARLLTWRPTTGHAIVIAALFVWSVDGLDKVSQFLYFTF